MGERAKRVGLNEAVFREVNERIEDLADALNLDETGLDLVCECGSSTCVERITMTRAEYETLRSEPTHFAVVPGHEIPDVEDVVEKRAGYDIVRKHEGEPASIAQRTDSRN